MIWGESSLGNRPVLLAHVHAITDLVLDARDELSALQLRDLLEWVAGLAGELERAAQPNLERCDLELRRLRKCLRQTDGLAAIDAYDRAP